MACSEQVGLKKDKCHPRVVLLKMESHGNGKLKVYKNRFLSSVERKLLIYELKSCDLVWWWTG